MPIIPYSRGTELENFTKFSKSSQVHNPHINHLSYINAVVEPTGRETARQTCLESDRVGELTQGGAKAFRFLFVTMHDGVFKQRA